MRNEGAGSGTQLYIPTMEPNGGGNEKRFVPLCRNPGRLTVLNTARLISGMRYQRKVEKRIVNKLVREWNPVMLTPLVVSHREGRYYLIDGQHRVAAMRRIYGGDVKTDCVVHEGLTYQQEAELYIRFDSSIKRITKRQSVNAMLESRNDTRPQIIKELLKQAGFHWALKGRNPANYYINVTSTLFRVYDLLGPEGFRRLFTMLSGTWKGVPTSITARMISGTALFLKTYMEDLDDYVFTLRLSTHNPGDILRMAQESGGPGNTPTRIAHVLLDLYNKGCRTGGDRSLPYRFKD